jgi:hypothetical protein
MDIEEAQKVLTRSVAKRRQWQWSEEDASQMDEALRPRTTFNNIAPVADAIAGHEGAVLGGPVVHDLHERSAAGKRAASQIRYKHYEFG